MARPVKTNPRVCQLNISLAPDELNSIKRRAEAVGVRTVDFCRTMLLAGTKQHIAPQQSEERLQRLIYSALSRLGNNLNQLLKRLHMTGDPLPADLEPLLTDIRAILNRRDRNDC